VFIVITSRRVRRYQRGNQNPYIEEEQTTQWSREEEQTTQWPREEEQTTQWPREEEQTTQWPREEEQTTQWPKAKVQKVKQRSKNTHIKLKIECSGRVISESDLMGEV
jgi:hypothetical protein